MHVVAAVHCEINHGRGRGSVEQTRDPNHGAVQPFVSLFAIPIARRHSRLQWKSRQLAKFYKVVLWPVYQLADTTAIYALGHMAISSSPYGERRQLMAPWAALLLVHLVTDSSSQNI